VSEPAAFVAPIILPPCTPAPAKTTDWMTDLIRRESARRRRETEVVEEAARVSETGLDAAPVEDDALVLLFWLVRERIRIIEIVRPAKRCW
jgi:hypothetical protein